MDFLHASGVGDFKLFVSLFLFLMAPYPDFYAGGNLGCAHSNDMVPETRSLSGRDGNTGKGKKQAVGKHDL